MSLLHPEPPAVPVPPGVTAGGEPLPETSRHEPVVRPWELELLISGAVVFSLLQLPGAVDNAFERLEPHLGGRSHVGIFLLYVYVKLALYTLIGGFILHLSVRAYWVGLIGLEVVYPAGIRWENTSYGSVMGEVFRERLGRLQARIDAADRFCSILFPLAFTLVMLSLYSIAALLLISAVAFAVSRLLLGGEYFNHLFVTSFVLLLSIPMLSWTADRLWGKRVEPGGSGHRALRRMSIVAYYVNAMPAYGTVFLTLYSNARKRKRSVAFYGLMLVLFAFVLVKDVFVREGVMRAGGAIHLPDVGGEFGVDTEYYEDQRRPGPTYERVPSIQSDVVRGPYVRLFIPYQPIRHGEAFAEACPGLRPLSTAGVRLELADPPAAEDVRAVLDCWMRLQPVTLNGSPVRPDFRFFTHPRTGVRGIVAYLPTAQLPRGANVITVGAAPRDSNDQRRLPDGRPKPIPPHYIHFWL